MTSTRRPRAGRRGHRAERSMVPEASFGSYYGRPVLKAAPWSADVPAYLFLGGLAAGSSLLGAGADLSRRPVLRRSSRLTAFAAVLGSMGALVHDLGRPGRFLHMLRVLKPTSPMSVGTWLLAGYGPLTALAATAELAELAGPRVPAGLGRATRLAARPAGLAAGALAPAVASYTAVLLADTATPAWHESRRELPFVFAGSSAAAAGGLALITTPAAEAGPARRLAVGGACLELTAGELMTRSAGLAGEALHHGSAGRLMRTAKALTGLGVLGTLAGRRSPVATAVSGAALLAGSACTRFGIFHAGQASARDPKYTVVPQRERLERDGANRPADGGPSA